MSLFILGLQRKGLNNKKPQHFFTHQYPSWLLNHPQWIHLFYTFNYLLQLRKWYIVKRLNKLLASKTTPYRLLDAGCGEGQFLFPFAASRKTAFFKGIDREKTNISFCNRYAQHYGLTHILFEETETEQLKEKELYDIILCISVLPYSKNDEVFLSCLYNAMKPGGDLLLYVPVNNHTILPFYKKIMQRYENYESVQQNQRVYHEVGLIKLLQDCNFLVTERTKTYGFFGKLSNELLNIHLILFNAYSFLFKIIIFFSLLLFYPLILLCMLLDYTLPVRSGNGLMIVARK